MAAKLATVEDRILARVEEAGAVCDNIISRSASDKFQVDGLRFDCGYLSPYFVTNPERMEVAFGRNLQALAIGLADQTRRAA